MAETPAKKPGRPRKAAAKPSPEAAVEPVDESKTVPGPETPELPTISVEELVGGLEGQVRKAAVVVMFDHLTGDLHKLTPGEARIVLGYGVPGRDKEQDEAWASLGLSR